MFAFKSVIARAQVFARMSPDDKALLVSSLQSHYLDQQIGMCGDGANDCAALKTADAGISLSESEASIAAPFTSKVQNIACCITLIREGKASLTATFQTFKFIELYALIQFYFTFLLYFTDPPTQPTDGQYLYIDLLVTFPLTIFIAMTRPQPNLTSDLPTESLFYLPILMSVTIMAFIQFGFQTYMLFNVRKQPFFQNPVNMGGDTLTTDQWVSFEDTTLFYVGNFQYLAACVAFSVSKPYRMPIYDNKLLFISLIIAYIAAFVVLFLPATNPFMWGLFQDVEYCDFDLNAIPKTTPQYPSSTCYPDYNYFIIIVGVVDTILTYLVEALFIRKFTVSYDNRHENQKLIRFAESMEALIPKTDVDFRASSDTDTVRS